MKTIWETIIYEPIYNFLVFSAQNITFKDIGIAVILVTLLIRVILYPLSKKSTISQYKMRGLQPRLDEIKKLSLSKEEEAKKTMELYKEEKVNPFSGCLLILIQLPILFALYFVFIRGISQPEHLYSFLDIEGLNNMFLGIIDITKPYLPLAILAGLSQSVQAFMMPKPIINEADKDKFQNQFTKSMTVQTKFVLPLIIIFMASKLAAAVSIYWVVTNIFSIFQDLYLRRKLNTHLPK